MRQRATFTLALAMLAAVNTAADGQPSDCLCSFVEGRDEVPMPLPSAALEKLSDPFAILVLRGGQELPITLSDLLKALDKYNEDQAGLPEQLSFFVSESGTIQEEKDTANLVRSFRMIFTRGPQNRPKDPSLFVSAPAGTRPGFLELMAWDPIKKAFNFYRRPDPNHWVWHKYDMALDVFPRFIGTRRGAHRNRPVCHAAFGRSAGEA